MCMCACVSLVLSQMQSVHVPCKAVREGRDPLEEGEGSSKRLRRMLAELGLDHGAHGSAVCGEHGEEREHL